MNIEECFLHRNLNLWSPMSLQCQQTSAVARTSSIVTSTVARLRAVPCTLSLDRPLLLVTTVIVILIHIHLTSRGLQVWLLRLRLRRGLRLDRRRGLGRRLRLRLRRRELLSWGCWCRLLFPTLLCCGDARRRLRINLRWAESWRVVSRFGRVVVFSSASLVICTSHL